MKKIDKLILKKYRKFSQWPLNRHITYARIFNVLGFVNIGCFGMLLMGGNILELVGLVAFGLLLLGRTLQVFGNFSPKNDEVISDIKRASFSRLFLFPGCLVFFLLSLAGIGSGNGLSKEFLAFLGMDALLLSQTYFFLYCRYDARVYIFEQERLTDGPYVYQKDGCLVNEHGRLPSGNFPWEDSL